MRLWCSCSSDARLLQEHNNQLNYVYEPPHPASPQPPPMKKSPELREKCSFVTLPYLREPSTLIAIGGMNFFNNDIDTPGKGVLEYQPWLNKWMMVATLPFPTHHHTATLLQGKLCVMGVCCLHYSVVFVS